MFNNNKKSHVSIEINDYVLRALVMKGNAISQAKVYEVALPQGVIEEASVKDEMTLFSIFKENAQKWGGKKQNVRFFVPDPSVLLKTLQHPPEITRDKLKEYIQMELGHSIHLPFEDPLIDVYDFMEGDGQAVMFAAASEDVHKYMHLFMDIHMKPQVADIRAISNLRLLNKMELLKPNKTYLIVNWLINELSISIYSNGQVDFLRYQPIGTDLSQWKSKINRDEVEFINDEHKEDYQMAIADQALELDRIMNFFKFSLHKGEKSVDEMIVLGDNPMFDKIENILKDSLPIPIKIVDDELIGNYYPGFKAKHASIIGLALKEMN